MVADGDVAPRAALDAAWPGWADGIALVIAADGGARHVRALGFDIDRWVGDGDSLGADEIAALRERGVPVDLFDPEKDESDAELAVQAAVAAGADEVTILGGVGGARLDHALTNISLLANPALGDRPAALLDASARIRLLRAPGPDGRPVRTSLAGRVGDLVTLIPWGSDGEGVRTTGLRYPLRDETLVLGSARGLSNVRVSPRASVTVGTGFILVIESPARLSS